MDQKERERLIRIVLDQFRAMGMGVREEVIEKRRLRTDPAYFDEWCTRLHEWYPEGPGLLLDATGS